MKWIDQPAGEYIKSTPGVHPLVQQILARRGQTDPHDIKSFLDSNAYKPTDANQLPGMESAVHRVFEAILQKQTIGIWGDFDADGQTATTVLVQTLQTLGADVIYHIPIRARESHGVNLDNLKILFDRGADLIISCDTGITAHEAITYSKSRGKDFIITDHHDLPETLPAAYALINPKLLPPNHSLANLSGVGVAYLLCEEINKRQDPASSSQELLDLVAIGMVADLAVLKNDTRYLVQKGLDQLRQTPRLGLKTMMEIAELSDRFITEEHIGFILGPRLNALGRLGDANPSVELLTTADPVRARVLATHIEGLNVQRKLICDQVYQAAEAQLRENPSLIDEPVIILSHPNWPGGVVGIVASKLAAKYQKPAILFSSPKDEPARGSARSVEGLNITEAISSQKDLLLGFGGHPMAAGLSLEPEKIPQFRRGMNRKVQSFLGDIALEEGIIKIDAWMDLEDITLELSDALETLSPFGPGNEKPVLAARAVKIVEKQDIGKNREHSKLIVEDEKTIQKEILWWDGGGEAFRDGKVDLAFTLRSSDWRGSRHEQLELVAVRPLAENTISVSSTQKELIDWRKNENKPMLLSSIPENIQIWAEGPERSLIRGVDRINLRPANSMVIWTSPPSLFVLQHALEIVKPATIYLIAESPDLDNIPQLLERLLGLVKNVYNQKDGRSSLEALAAACAHTDHTIHMCLLWLKEQGVLEFELENGDQLTISSLKNKRLHPNTVYRELADILEETEAFRHYFENGNLDSLFG